MIVHPIRRAVQISINLERLLFRPWGPLLKLGSAQTKLISACCSMHTRHSSGARLSTPSRGFHNLQLSYTASYHTQEETPSAESPSPKPPEAAEGTTAPQPQPQREVAILWDLDNVQPNGPVADAVRDLRRLAKAHGDKVVEFSAAASQHALNWIPFHVREERAERKEFNRLEASGEVAAPEEPYRCPVCGAKCKTNNALEKHYKQLHERELTKKKNHLNSMKKGSKKAKKFLEKHGADLRKRTDAHYEIVGYKKGYGLRRQLQQAGVKVKVVSDDPESADMALEQRWASLAGKKNLSALVLVSDDSGFGAMLSHAKRRGVRTIVVGEEPDGKLAKRAHQFVSWYDGMSGIADGSIEPEDGET